MDYLRSYAVFTPQNTGVRSPLSSPSERTTSPILKCSSQLKRKLSLKSRDNKENVAFKQQNNPVSSGSCDIIILSDSDQEDQGNFRFESAIVKKIKKEVDIGPTVRKDEAILTEIDQEFAYSIKQEHIDYDEGIIQVDSDTDSESENWFLRLSQSSPGKPFTNTRNEKIQSPSIDSSYSQLEDDICEEDLKYMDDIITIPPHPPETEVDGFIYNVASTSVPIIETTVQPTIKDNSYNKSEKKDKKYAETNGEVVKKIQLIEPLQKPTKRKAHTVTEGTVKSRSKSASTKNKKLNNETRLSNTSSTLLKEERKKKLKEIANKDDANKDEQISCQNLLNNANKPIVNAKVTTSNRGAFLTNVVQATVKPTKRKENQGVTATITESKIQSKNDIPKKVVKETKSKETKTKEENLKVATNATLKADDQNTKPKTPIPDKIPQRPILRVEPNSASIKTKSVRFSDLPEVREFLIEPENSMKKTSTVKTRKLPQFSLEKITLMKILRWNPTWLEEQIKNPEPPPILGHRNLPMAMFHTFESHKQYVQMVGDLILMEIWECLTQAYVKLKNSKEVGLPLRIESLPPVPPQERYFELTNISVNVSMPASDLKYLPKVGEILTIEFGPEKGKICRFFFVHHVRNLPSPPNNKFKFFSISLYATFSETMRSLKPGELLIGKILAHINNELTLFEAMERLASSPLSEAILRPHPQHFPSDGPTCHINMTSPWTQHLNPSQQVAVRSSVSAALSNRPSIQMVQGPPGTGKSSVICSIVMKYFYDETNKKQNNRNKILICATSNAAVDALVNRLLHIRQELPKSDRFRMVRVGRLESMHPRARDVSSQHLAQRDARAHHDPPPQPSAALEAEISLLEAKINMWKTSASEAKEPERITMCRSRIDQFAKRLAMLRGAGGGAVSGGEEPRPDQLLQSERRIIECADIVATTLASMHNCKMRGLEGRFALCIVDEAGQAIEPETLIPLTLGVTSLTLVGDPQQLHGFICSQRAKKHGLGESLFSRLSSYTEHWSEGSPVVLLDQQYRMHPDIADYPNRAFYGGRIRNMVAPAPYLDLPPYCILNISSGDRGQNASGANEVEAWGVARVAGALAGEARARGQRLALITPYAAQRDLLRRCLRDLHDASIADAVEVNTVDSFQGQERDVVIVSLARSNGVGFLTDAGRMNVMLTRARSAMLVCLNTLAVMKNDQWRTLVEDAQRRHLYTALPNKICQGPSATIPRNEILKCITRLKH